MEARLNLNDDDKPVKCSKCGAIVKYKSHGEYLCSNEECGNIERDNFGKIRDYLDRHGPVSATVISQETGISVNKITAYLAEGRLEFANRRKI